MKDRKGLIMEKTVETLLNEQITKEYFSAYLYMSMAAYLEDKNFPGMAHWMKVQVQEEMIHGTKFFEYMNDRGSRVTLGAIDKPKSDFASVKEVFEDALAHEKKVTASINNIYAEAQKANDNATMIFLQWFITEQVEEEKSASDIISKLEMIKDNPMGLVMLDKELSSRAQPVMNPSAE